jgi:hypothetical protein
MEDAKFRCMPSVDPRRKRKQRVNLRARARHRLKRKQLARFITRAGGAAMGTHMRHLGLMVCVVLSAGDAGNGGPANDRWLGK